MPEFGNDCFGMIGCWRTRPGRESGGVGKPSTHHEPNGSRWPCRRIVDNNFCGITLGAWQYRPSAELDETAVNIGHSDTLFNGEFRSLGASFGAKRDRVIIPSFVGKVERHMVSLILVLSTRENKNAHEGGRYRSERCSTHERH